MDTHVHCTRECSIRSLPLWRTHVSSQSRAAQLFPHGTEAAAAEMYSVIRTEAASARKFTRRIPCGKRAASVRTTIPQFAETHLE